MVSLSTTLSAVDGVHSSELTKTTGEIKELSKNMLNLIFFELYNTKDFNNSVQYSEYTLWMNQKSFLHLRRFINHQENYHRMKIIFLYKINY